MSDGIEGDGSDQVESTAPEATDETTSDDAKGMRRRDIMRKTIIGAGAAGVVWSAPRIEGLSVRPDYASAASATDPTDPSAPFDQSFFIDSLATGGPYVLPGNGFPNLAFGYGWNVTGGPGTNDFSISGASDCTITVDALDIITIPPDTISTDPIQPGAPFPLTTFRRYSWGPGGQNPSPQGLVHFHFTC